MEMEQGKGSSRGPHAIDFHDVFVSNRLPVSRDVRARVSSQLRLLIQNPPRTRLRWSLVRFVCLGLLLLRHTHPYLRWAPPPEALRYTSYLGGAVDGRTGAVGWTRSTRQGALPFFWGGRAEGYCLMRMFTLRRPRRSTVSNKNHQTLVCANGHKVKQCLFAGFYDGSPHTQRIFEPHLCSFFLPFL